MDHQRPTHTRTHTHILYHSEVTLKFQKAVSLWFTVVETRCSHSEWTGHSLVRCLVPDGYAGEQRRLKPASNLVLPFHICICPGVRLWRNGGQGEISHCILMPQKQGKQYGQCASQRTQGSRKDRKEKAVSVVKLPTTPSCVQ